MAVPDEIVFRLALAGPSVPIPLDDGHWVQEGCWMIMIRHVRVNSSVAAGRQACFGVHSLSTPVPIVGEYMNAPVHTLWGCEQRREAQ